MDQAKIDLWETYLSEQGGLCQESYEAGVTRVVIVPSGTTWTEIIDSVGLLPHHTPMDVVILTHEWLNAFTAARRRLIDEKERSKREKKKQKTRSLGSNNNLKIFPQKSLLQQKDLEEEEEEEESKSPALTLPPLHE